MTDCRNCGAPVESNFCPQCGQPARDPRGPLRKLLAEFSSVQLSLDAKLVRSLRALLFEPGRMTASYVAGERSRWVHPARLYTALALVCFAFVHIPVPDNVEVLVNGEVLGQTGEGEPAITLDLLDADSRLSQWVHGDASDERVEELRALGPRVLAERFFHSLSSAVPTGSLVMLPFVGAVLLLIFLRRPWFYYDHLIFSLHVQSFVLVLVLASWLLPVPLTWILAIATVYVFLALRRTYELTWLGALWRIVPLGFLYGVSFALVFIGTLLRASLSI